MTKQPQIVWRIKTYNTTVIVLAESIAKASTKALRVLRRDSNHQPIIETVERIGQPEEP